MAAAASAPQSSPYHVGTLKDLEYDCPWGKAKPIDADSLKITLEGGLLQQVLFKLGLTSSLALTFSPLATAKVVFLQEMGLTEADAHLNIHNTQKIGVIMRKILAQNPQDPQRPKTKALHFIVNAMLTIALYDPDTHLEQILKTEQVDGQPADKEALVFVRQAMKTAATHQENRTKLGIPPPRFDSPEAGAIDYIKYIRDQTKANANKAAAGSAAAPASTNTDAKQVEGTCCIA